MSGGKTDLLRVEHTVPANEVAQAAKLLIREQ